MSVDFEAEGLLDGLDGDARAGRLKLLEQLAGDGVELEELREAVAEGRLALLPVERALEGDGRYTLEEIAERSGVETEQLRRQRQAIGLPIVDEGDGGSDEDLAAAQRIRILLDAGIPPDGLLEVTRVIGIAMSQLAAANRTLITQALIQPDDTEYEVANRLAGAAKALTPLVGETLSHALRMHLREQIRHDMLGGGGAAAQGVAGTQEITACFADLVGYTRLGEHLPVEELGAVTGRLNELAASAVTGPVRLVKLIGDGVMLVSQDTDALLESALTMTAAAEDMSDDELPQLRTGVARGAAIPRGGDWYGPPINMASRIADIAYAGSVLANETAKDDATDAFTFSFAGERRLKGIKEEQKLFRARHAGAE
jgi:adenylate cyclase